MSEHTKITGKCFYYHIPYREDNGFTFCKRCKRFVDKIEIQFNEGWLSDWQQVNCGHCKKAIWVMEFAGDCSNKAGKRIFIEDDKICGICGKPTNHYDCFVYGGRIGKKIKYWCSKKCRDKQDKIDIKECEIMRELELSAEEQKIELDFKTKLKLAGEILKNENR
jgi:hypothetical protein